jgi:hypothetical protein
MTSLVREVVTDLLGPDRVLERERGMVGEDMAYFLQKAPGCFFQVGTNNPERGLIYGHHHPRFDIDDEQSLPVGVAAVTSVALRYLNGSENGSRSPGITLGGVLGILGILGRGYGPHPLPRDPLRWVPHRVTGEGELPMR